MNENLLRLIFYVDTKIDFNFSEFFAITGIILGIGYCSIAVVKFFGNRMGERHA